MGLTKQTWTLTVKNIRIVLFRKWLSTTIRAFLAPIIFMFFISYAKNFLIPPAEFGIGSPTAVRSLTDALDAAGFGRNTVAFVNNGFEGGEIEAVIDRLARPIQEAGKTVRVLSRDVELLDVCRSSLRGVTPCYAAATFHSSPSEGPDSIWNYTIRADGSFGTSVYVDRTTNEAQIYVIPFQHAIDSAIASTNGTQLPTTVEEYPFTSRNATERDENITRLYMDALIDILAVAYFIGVVGVTYQLTGQMASERELGMSQLIEVMLPNVKNWEPQAARLISNHLAFDIIYLPGWIIMGLILSGLTFPTSDTYIMVIFHILAGLALSSWSIAFASLFKKAQLSGITVTITSIILAIIIQVQRPDSASGVILLALFFPPMNYTLFILYMAYWQQGTRAADLSKPAPNAPWQVAGYVFWILLIVQTILYPIIGAYLEKFLHGTASKTRRGDLNSSNSSKAVELTSFSKHYPPSWFQRNVAARFGRKPQETVLAVRDLSLTVLKGQIMVLLGANGSGKSTTLDAIAGLNSITSGSIEYDGAGGLGLCPQKNVMWENLTVFEHVKIFDRLKTQSGKSSNKAIADLVAACDLKDKMNEKAKTLSGGQKRKLQLAMMFVGGSHVCCVDEVSSGLDPISRRKIWDILLSERGRRTILLTTHFLDEADLLSDQIAMLSKGALVASGSAVELKHRFGSGYRVHIYNDRVFVPPPEWEAAQKQVLRDQTIFQFQGSAEAARFIQRLEADGIHEYQVNGPTIEDVFLKLAEEVREAPTSQDEKPGDNNPSAIAQDVKSEEIGEKGLQLVAGKEVGLLRQSWELFRKRLIVLRRNYLPYCAALLIPIITAGLVTFFIQDFNGLSCSPEDQVSESEIFSFSFFTNRDLPFGPSSLVSSDDWSRTLPFLNRSGLRPVESVSDFNAYIAANYSQVAPGGLFLRDDGETPLFAYRANFDLSGAVLTQNLLDNTLLGFPVATSFRIFELPFAPDAEDSLKLVLFFGLAMCAFPAFFALYPTVERLKKIRALHYSNGVRASSLWLAYMCFDLIFILIVSALTVIIFTSVSGVWYYPGYLFLIFFLYGLAATLAAYVVSLFTSSQLAAFAFTAGGHCSLFLIYFVAYMLILTYSPPSEINSNVNIAHFTIALVTPAGNMLRALLLSLNQFSLLCRDRSLASDPGGITVYGGPILYLIIQSILLFAILVWWDSGWKPPFLLRTSSKRKDAEYGDGVDSEVFSEVNRVKNSQDPLRVLDVSKNFGDNLAVQDVSFGVQRGEIFALLGPNGAGKSTTISLIRGDIRPSNSDGDVLVEGTSIVRQRTAARSHLGVCPQFDAMDQMTVVEHLRFYARVRGAENVEFNVEQVVKAVGLQPMKQRMAAKLSGGNKRKLSLGIALMGNPSVLLLDEPSSGMDAASKRLMWRTLSSVTAGRSLLLTTHSMEEADALANRAGIMAKKMLALDRIDALRTRFGDTYNVHLVHKDAPFTSDADMEKMKAWIRAVLPQAVLEEKTFHGQLRFNVPSALRPVSKESDESSLTELDAGATDQAAIASEVGPIKGHSGISALFTLLETHQAELGFEYYSVGQSTLDQVFLNIIGRHNVAEEDYARQASPRVGVFKRFRSGLLELFHNA